jgi:hypothetical protein
VHGTLHYILSQLLCLYLNGYKICHQFIGISLYNFHSINGIKCMPIDFVLFHGKMRSSHHESYNAPKTSSNNNSIKWYLYGQSFCMVYALFLHVGWSKIIDIANSFFPHQFKTCRTWDSQNWKLILLSFLLHHKAQDLYTLRLSNTLKLNWLIFRSKSC